MMFLFLTVKFDRIFVILSSLFVFRVNILLSLVIFIKVGNKVKVVIIEVNSPKVIIQPKSITGLIPLKIKDKNAQIVVSPV